MLKELITAMDIEKQIIAEDKKVQTIFGSANLSSLGMEYDGLNTYFPVMENSIDEKYKKYVSVLNKINETQKLVVNDKNDDIKRGNNYLLIKECEKSLKELYQQPKINTVEFAKNIALTPELKKQGMEQFADYIEDAYEGSNVKDYVENSLKRLDQIERELNKDVIKALTMYIDFQTADLARIEVIKRYSDTLQKGLNKSVRVVEKHKTGLQNTCKNIVNRIESVNSGEELEKLENELDKLYKEYSSKKGQKKK